MVKFHDFLLSPWYLPDGKNTTFWRGSWRTIHVLPRIADLVTNVNIPKTFQPEGFSGWIRAPQYTEKGIKCIGTKKRVTKKKDSQNGFEGWYSKPPTGFSMTAVLYRNEHHPWGHIGYCFPSWYSISLLLCLRMGRWFLLCHVLPQHL